MRVPRVGSPNRFSNYSLIIRVSSGASVTGTSPSGVWMRALTVSSALLSATSTRSAGYHAASTSALSEMYALLRGRFQQ